ncbi:MAG: cysteine peptidase family C39 domain-containing protein, partial [Mucilaginibacter sp.]
MLKILSKFLEPKSNVAEMAILSAKLLDIKISETTLKKEIEEHPDYPSLLSISDVFNNYRVENLAAKVDENFILNVPVPFITQFKGRKNTIDFFTVVREINKSTINFFDPEKHKWSTASTDDFLKRSSGIVLLIQAGEEAGERDYNQKIKEERRSRLLQYLITLFIPTLAIIVGINNFAVVGLSTLLPFVYSLITLVGCLICILLIWYELDQHNPALQKICSN